MDQPPLFTLGWFRSGTTHLFRMLRAALPEWTHFYEPFNPNVGRFTASYRELRRREPGNEDQLFDSFNKAELFRTYTRVGEPVEKRFEPGFARGNFFLSEQSSYPALREYLHLLTHFHPPTHLQINRGLGRIGFIRDLYPEARFLCIVRDPRAVWASWQGYPDDPFDPELPPEKFSLGPMNRELEAQIPSPVRKRWGFEWARKKPPVASFLVMWGFLHQLLHEELKSTPACAWIRYEDLVNGPGPILRNVSRELELDRLEGGRLPDSHTKSIHRWREQSNPADYRGLLDTLPEDNQLTVALEAFGYFEEE